MKIVSLLPAATEIVADLGLRDSLVGRSHECDFPADVAALPALTRARVDSSLPSEALDAEVRRIVASRLPIYMLDEARLGALAPDVVVTQEACEVCADLLRPGRELPEAHGARGAGGIAAAGSSRRRARRHRSGGGGLRREGAWSGGRGSPPRPPRAPGRGRTATPPSRRRHRMAGAADAGRPLGPRRRRGGRRRSPSGPRRVRPPRTRPGTRCAPWRPTPSSWRPAASTCAAPSRRPGPSPTCCGPSRRGSS